MEPKLLFVDDEELIHKALKRVFRSESYELLSAYNGAEAVKMAQEQSPQLILLDVCMPGTDGYQVMREIRKNEKTKNIPVLMLTGKGEVLDKVVGYELGVEDYVTKPFNAEELKRHVESFLNKRKG